MQHVVDYCRIMDGVHVCALDIRANPRSIQKFRSSWQTMNVSGNYLLDQSVTVWAELSVFCFFSSPVAHNSDSHVASGLGSEISRTGPKSGPVRVRSGPTPDRTGLFLQKKLRTGPDRTASASDRDRTGPDRTAPTPDRNFCQKHRF